MIRTRREEARLSGRIAVAGVLCPLPGLLGAGTAVIAVAQPSALVTILAQQERKEHA